MKRAVKRARGKQNSGARVSGGERGEGRLEGRGEN